MKLLQGGSLAEVVSVDLGCDSHVQRICSLALSKIAKIERRTRKRCFRAGGAGYWFTFACSGNSTTVTNSMQQACGTNWFLPSKQFIFRRKALSLDTSFMCRVKFKSQKSDTNFQKLFYVSRVRAPGRNEGRKKMDLFSIQKGASMGIFIPPPPFCFLLLKKKKKPPIMVHFAKPPPQSFSIFLSFTWHY